MAESGISTKEVKDHPFAVALVRRPALIAVLTLAAALGTSYWGYYVGANGEGDFISNEDSSDLRDHRTTSFDALDLGRKKVREMQKLASYDSAQQQSQERRLALQLPPGYQRTDGPYTGARTNTYTESFLHDYLGVEPDAKHFHGGALRWKRSLASFPAAAPAATAATAAPTAPASATPDAQTDLGLRPLSAGAGAGAGAPRDAHRRALQEEAECYSGTGKGRTRRKCGRGEEPAQTEIGDILYIIYGAKGEPGTPDGDNVFTAKGLASMKRVTDKVEGQADFGTYCHKQVNQCRLPRSQCEKSFSPLLLFYSPFDFAQFPLDHFSHESFESTHVDLLPLVKSAMRFVCSAGASAIEVQVVDPEYATLENTTGCSATMQAPAWSNYRSCASSVVEQLALSALSKKQSAALSAYADAVSTHGQGAVNKTLELLVAAEGFFKSVNEEPSAYSAAPYYNVSTATLQWAGETAAGAPLNAVDTTLRVCAHLMQSAVYRNRLAFFFDKNFTPETPVSKYTRSFLGFGVPLEGFSNRDDRESEQRRIVGRWFRDSFNDFLNDEARDGPVDVLFFATALVLDEFLAIIYRDVTLAGLSCIMIFAYLCINTGSLFVAAVAIVEILLALPTAYWIYRVVLGFTFLHGLASMCLFIIMAIGADDVFVFMDAYKQSAHVLPRGAFGGDDEAWLRKRMSWTYRRAATAMLITSFTTMAAFIATAISPLAQVRSFGAFAALVILTDYILVITWFPACVVLYHRHIERRCCCCGACCPCLCSKRELEDAPPRKRCIERFLGGPFCEFVISWRRVIIGVSLGFMIPVLVLMLQLAVATKPVQDLPSDHKFQRIFDIMQYEFPSSSDDRNSQVHLFWGMSGVDRSGVNLLKNISNRGDVTWDDSFVFDQEAQLHLKSACAYARFAGGQRTDGAGTAPPAEFARMLTSDTENNTQQESSYLSVYGMGGHGPRSGKVDCFIDSFEHYMLQHHGPGSWPTNASHAYTALSAWAEATSPNPETGFPVRHREAWDGMFGLDPGAKRVMYVALRMETDMRRHGFQTQAELETKFAAFEWLKDKVNSEVPATRIANTTSSAHTFVRDNGDSVVVAASTAPASANKALQTCDGPDTGGKWVWLRTQIVYTQTATRGAIMGTFLAFAVIFVATQNALIALCAALSIAFILMSVTAAIVVMGWELGVIEAICLTILAGFSVDYVVHLAHAYMDAGHAATRADRVRKTFEDIGISVFSGMITSVTAAQPLFACTLQFFAKFGGFLCFTVFFSWCFANFFFMACLAEFGPQPPTEVGSVRWLTCGALDLSIHREKQAAGAAAAAANVGTVTVSDGDGDEGDSSSTSTQLRRGSRHGVKHVV